MKKFTFVTIFIGRIVRRMVEKFVFTMLDKELKFDRYENSFLWLKDAGVA